MLKRIAQQRRPKRTYALLFLSLGCILQVAACQNEDATQIVISIATDFEIPNELNHLTFMAGSKAEKDRYKFSYDLSTDNKKGFFNLPATIALNSGDDPLKPVHITVIGQNTKKLNIKGNNDVAIREARLPWVPSRVILLRMNLLKNCMYIFCDETNDKTCIDGECKEILITSPTSLPNYDEKEAFRGVDAGPTPRAGTHTGSVRQHYPVLCASRPATGGAYDACVS